MKSLIKNLRKQELSLHKNLEKVEIEESGSYNNFFKRAVIKL
jgi:hypothetical protein